MLPFEVIINFDHLQLAVAASTHDGGPRYFINVTLYNGLYLPAWYAFFQDFECLRPCA